MPGVASQTFRATTQLARYYEIGSNRLNYSGDQRIGKPFGINLHIGRRPIAAFGNSDGDMQMLQWTKAGEGARFGLLIHHRDADREWAHDRKSHIGRLDMALDEAQAKGWTVVDIKNDWKVVYPFETSGRNTGMK